MNHRDERRLADLDHISAPEALEDKEAKRLGALGCHRYVPMENAGPASAAA
jgi:hypothetical protein